MENYINIEAFKLFDEWELYNYTHTIENHSNYKFNINTGELFNTNFIKVGKFGQETINPYIYMDDCSYIRLLSKYNKLVKDTPIAKSYYQHYIDSKDL